MFSVFKEINEKLVVLARARNYTKETNEHFRTGKDNSELRVWLQHGLARAARELENGGQVMVCNSD